MARVATENRFSIRDLGTCLDFDGVDDVVILDAEDEFSASSKITLSAWIKPRVHASVATLIAKRGAGQTTFQWRLDNGSFRFTWTQGGSFNSYDSTVSIPLNKWSFVALTFDWASPGSANYYLNGSFTTKTRTAGSGTTPDDAGVAISVGRRNDDAQEFNGKMDDIRIFNTVLSQTQLNNLYYGNVSSAPLHHLKFDEGSGSTAIDSGTGATNGTITGATYSTDVAFKPRSAALGRIQIDGDPLQNYIKSLIGLVAYYPLDETSGNAINHAPATLGTLDGTVTGATQGVAGQSGNAYSFDGVNDAVSIPYHISYSTSQPFSWGFLAKISSTEDTGSHTIVGAREGGTASEAIVYIDSSGKPKVFVAANNNTNIHINSPTTDMRDDAYHLWTFVRDVAADKGFLYVDGVLIGSIDDNTTTTIDMVIDLNIGARNLNGTTDRFIVAEIQHVFFTESALVSDQITRLAQLSELA